MTHPLVYVIVLNWNGRHHLAECLGSLAKACYPNLRILVVDNASTDGSVDFVRSTYPAMEVIVNDANLGFAEGNNVGIRHALSKGADYVVLLNNDTRVEPDFLDHLIRRGEESSTVGVLGGTVLMYADPSLINSTGVNLNRFAYGWDRDFGEDARRVTREAGEVLAVTGCLMAVKRRVIEEIGMLDSSFFAYFEDVDFCIRVWKDSGFSVEYVPGAIIYHKFSGSTSGDSLFKRSLMVRNQYRVLFKHFPIREILRILPAFTLHRLGMILYHLKMHDNDLAIKEAGILLRHAALLPVIVLRRRKGQRRGSEQRFWELVIPDQRLPRLPSYRERYERVIREHDEVAVEGLPGRLIMGINDGVLGPGWSDLIEAYPRVRRVTKEAVCYLNASGPHEFLQIHGLLESSGPRTIEVSIGGESPIQIGLAFGWKTYILPLEKPCVRGAVEVRLSVQPPAMTEAGDRGFGVNEVSLLSLGSPALRLMAP